MASATAGPQVDLTGRVCVVTGASSGIGLAAARTLGALGAQVVMACRDVRRGEQARRSIAGALHPAGALEVLALDVTRPSSVAEFARAFEARHALLHVLVNNAGLASMARRQAADGIELTWSTNMLGYARVTEALLDALRAGRGRVINVASSLARDLDLDDVEFVRRPYDGVSAYAQSKQANRMWTWALARRLEGSGVVAHALHPGGVRTPIFRKAGGLKGLAGAVWALVAGRSPAQGADTAVFLASDDEAGRRSGLFWVDRTERRCKFRDPAAEEALYELCRDMLRRTAGAA